jgi:hypothetical protein
MSKCVNYFVNFVCTRYLFFYHHSLCLKMENAQLNFDEQYCEPILVSPLYFLLRPLVQ